MSDFDKEAERERLREKYEDETEDREATQRMSELLLKGATMTNSHCGNCGDPIFRYDGTEFCPSCNREDGTAAGDADAGANADANAVDAADATDVESDASASETTADAATPQPPVDVGASARRDPPSQTGASRGARVHDDVPSGAGQDRTRTETHDTGRQNAAAVDADAIGNVEATVQRFAAAAAETDDPERARDCLAAVRDAAETLRALRADGH